MPTKRGEFWEWLLSPNGANWRSDIQWICNYFVNYYYFFGVIFVLFWNTTIEMGYQKRGKGFQVVYEIEKRGENTREKMKNVSASKFSIKEK